MSNVSTTETASENESAAVAKMLAEHTSEINVLKRINTILLIGIVGSIIFIAIDLFKDRSLYDRVDQAERNIILESTQNEKLNTAIVQDMQMLKQCLKLGGWNTCFN